MIAPGFSVVAPAEDIETPLVVEVPHAGLAVDGEALAYLAAPARAIGRDADLYVDELYADAPARGATLLVAHVSRYVVDLNRSEEDVDPETVEGAPAGSRATRGIVWRLTSDGGKVLERPLPRRELDRRLDAYYRPYHRALAAAIAHKQARFGFAAVLAAHSMPSVSRPSLHRAAAWGEDTRAAHAEQIGHVVRADAVPGTRGRTSAAGTFIDAVEAHARAAKLSVAHDDPYQGGYTTQHYGKPNPPKRGATADKTPGGVHVVQLELARRLYMDETTLAKNAGWDRMRSWCADLVAVLGAVRP
jgi:N-formylglutamate amidohydrolase